MLWNPWHLLQFCPHCSKTFPAQIELISHLWTHRWWPAHFLSRMSRCSSLFWWKNKVCVYLRILGSHSVKMLSSLCLICIITRLQQNIDSTYYETFEWILRYYELRLLRWQNFNLETILVYESSHTYFWYHEQKKTNPI